MATKTTRTVLDAELAYLSRESAQSPRRRGSIPLKAVAAKSLTTTDISKIQAGDFVTIKVLSKASKRGDVGNWLRANRGKIVSETDQVLLVDLPVPILNQLDQCNDILRAEAARVLLPRMDMARGPATGLDDALTSHPLSGEGVVFGIIDSGIDWSHEDFRNSDGTTRLELFTYARQPEDGDVSYFDSFDTDAINDAINSNGDVNNGDVPVGDPNGHGTHCASIAVGNGLASGDRFRGVAPMATIMGMRSEPLLDTHTIWGIREFFERAGDRPAVISLSLGGHLGAHDGTSAIENVIARESGPGRIVVVAAGNEGGDGIHWQGVLSENEDLTIPVRVADPELQFVDVWVPRGDQVDVQIETPDGHLYDPTGNIESTVFGSFLADWHEDPINRDQNLTLLIAGSINHIWHIHISPDQITQGNVHAWGGTVNPSNNQSLFPGFNGKEYSIGMPGTEERAIVVGSLISKTQFETQDGVMVAEALQTGQLSSFSSYGPNRIGRLKPEIVAPGQYVTAALSENSHMATHPNYTPRHDPSGKYITIQGTSMATPFVAGVIALMLEREPTLTPEEVQQRLRITARRDDDTGRVWSPGFGFGKIDVEALLDYVV